ncbi:probable 6-phosphogluconolactonase 4, chloroplastic [Impatiens glandulifera]|uniref:probable 6-phosphogluconolactonase 4, chloroplastic n=1 Tax=Impatiens glandulifera TaxID=253017 RepID=UPI001FB105A1|nr:probable 6-phosphogluconolactonase 4, chloroplastic [Impatiens glandulifera]
MADHNPNVRVFDNEEAVAVSLAKYISDLSEKFVKQRGLFTVVLSGGSLIHTLRKLTESPYVESVDWEKWHVVWLDERVVPKTHDDSNYKLAYDGFLSKVKINPDHVYAINDTLSTEDAADDYEASMKSLVEKNIVRTSEISGFPKFDLNLMGMGPDGHVASLFPGHPLLKEEKRWVTFIKDSPKPPPQRITFTFPVINSSDCIAMVITGPETAKAVGIALGCGKNENGLLPVQMVAPEGELVWFLDKDTTSQL